MRKLKPCPFCGSDAIVGNKNDPFKLGGMRTNGPTYMTIGCVECGFYFCSGDFRPNDLSRDARLIEKWNKRAEVSK